MGRIGAGARLGGLDVIAGAAVLLVPNQAWALPGPEVVAPLAMGFVQLLVAGVWLAGPLLRKLREWRWRHAVLLGVGGMLTLLVSWKAAIVAVLLAGVVGAWSSSSRWRWTTGLLLALGVAALWLRPGERPPELRPFGPHAPAQGPLPRAKTPWLRSGPVLLVHVGEPEEFANCRASIGTVLRAADLPAAHAAIRRADAPVVLVVAPGEYVPAVAEDARGLGDTHVLPFERAFTQTDNDGSICYRPPFLELFQVLVPTALLPLRAPDAPLKLDRAPWLRASDVAHLLATEAPIRVIDANQVVRTPTEALSQWRGAPAVLMGEEVRRLAAAARLLTAQQVELVALGRGPPPSARQGTPLGSRSLALLTLLAILLALIARLVARLAAVRAEVLLALGRAPHWLPGAARASGEAGALAAAALCAGWAAARAVPLELAAWITPTMVGTSALAFGGAWLGVAGVAVWAAVLRLEGGWRLIASVAAAASLLPVIPSMVDGSGLLPLHLAVVAVALLGAQLVEAGVDSLWRRRQRDSAGRRPGWLWLDHAAELVAAGRKAGEIGARRAAGLPVPPGLVVWTDRQGTPGRSALLATRLLLGRAPLLVRSSSRAEDQPQTTAAGRFPSEPCGTLAELPQAIRRVASAYASTDEPLPAVLIMPLVSCTLGGVAQIPVPGTSAVLVEAGEGRAAVTAGRPADRFYWGRASHSWLGAGSVSRERSALGALLARIDESSNRQPRYVEWLARGRKLWMVQDRAAPAGVSAEGEAPVEQILGEVAPPVDPAAPWLRRIIAEALPRTASRQTVQLWAQRWRRSDALGDAFRLLGLPRSLAPERAVVGAWGALWSIVPQAEVMARVLHLRIALAAAMTWRTPAQVASGLAQRVLSHPRGFRQAVARSMALRMLEPYLEEKLHAKPPPSTSMELVRTLRNVGAPDQLPHRWSYRATWDLDPACPRYGERDDGGFGADEPAPSWPPPGVPKRLDRQWCARLRDALHDRLAWEVARRRAADDSWSDVSACEDQAAMMDALSLRDAESIGLPLEICGHPAAGVWVSGAGPIEGVVVRDPHEATAERILVVDAATPEIATHFCDFKAVVAASGGALSHAALVAREDEVPAIFGAGRDVLGRTGPVRLEEDGSISWLDDGERSAP